MGLKPRPDIHQGTGLSFQDAELSLNLFEALLNRYNIDVAPGSTLEEISLGLTEWRAFQRRQIERPDPKADFRVRWLRMLGLVDFARKLLRVLPHPEFETLVPHLRLFGQRRTRRGRTIDPDPTQTAGQTSGEDDENHKLFELLIASAALAFTTDMELETQNAADNPDLMCTFEGTRWGIACKVLHTQKVESYRERVFEGVQQLNRAGVKNGLVLVNVKELIPIDKFMPFDATGDEPYTVFESLDVLKERIDAFARHLDDRVGENATNLRECFNSADGFRGAGHYIHSLSVARRNGRVALTPFTEVHPLTLPDDSEVAPDVDLFRRLLNVAVQWGPPANVNATSQ